MAARPGLSVGTLRAGCRSAIVPASVPRRSKEMKVKLFAGLTAAACALALSGVASAQTPKAKRPLVAVTDFDFGTVGYHWWGDADIGKGMADQVMDQLLEDGSFRVVERKKLDTILAEQDFAHSDRADPGAAKLSKLGK